MLMVKPPVDEVQLIEYHATSIRRQIIQMLALAGSGHPASSLGLVEVLACLYFNVLRYNPADPNDDQRDLLVMSNGHACPALYATLAEAGLIDPLELRHLRQYGSRLQGHPERTRWARDCRRLPVWLIVCDTWIHLMIAEFTALSVMVSWTRAISGKR